MSNILTSPLLFVGLGRLATQGANKEVEGRRFANLVLLG